MWDLSFLKDTAVKVDERGRVEWSPETQMSSVKGVFLSREVVTGPGSAIAAVANGHRAALAMHLFCQGEAIEGRLPVQEREKIAQMPQEVAEKITKESRINIKHLAPEVRCDTFAHFEIGYDETEALKEAERCRGCGGGLAVVDPQKCMTCLTCMRICPYDAPVVTSVSEIRSEYCQACGLNTTYTPTTGDETPPWFVNLPDGFSSLYGSSIAIEFFANDSHAVDKFSVNNSLFTISTSYEEVEGSWYWIGWLENASITPVGNYTLNVSVNDTSGNLNSTIYSLNVTGIPANNYFGNVSVSVVGNTITMRVLYAGRSMTNLLNPVTSIKLVYKGTRNALQAISSSSFVDTFYVGSRKTEVTGKPKQSFSISFY